MGGLWYPCDLGSLDPNLLLSYELISKNGGRSVLRRDDFGNKTLATLQF